MPMNVALQRHMIEKRLRSKGVSPHTVDLDQLIDPTLRLPENIRNIEKQLGQHRERTGQSGARAKRHQFAKKTARKYHQLRSPWAMRMDEARDAEETFEDPTEEELRRWKNNPMKYDIKGVDTKQPKEDRTDATSPIEHWNRARRQARREQSLRRGARKAETAFQKTQEFDRLVSAAGSRQQKTRKPSTFTDKRSRRDVARNVKKQKGGDQQVGLRDGGFMAFKAEKTLGEFEETNAQKLMTGKKEIV